MPVKRDFTGVELKWRLRGFKGLVENIIESEGGFSAKWENFIWDENLGGKERRLKNFGVLDNEEGFTSLKGEVKEFEAEAMPCFLAWILAQELEYNPFLVLICKVEQCLLVKLTWCWESAKRGWKEIKIKEKWGQKRKVKKYRSKSANEEPKEEKVTNRY